MTPGVIPFLLATYWVYAKFASLAQLKGNAGMSDILLVAAVSGVSYMFMANLAGGVAREHCVPDL